MPAAAAAGGSAAIPGEPAPHGPGADLLDAHELGFFDRIGATVEPSPVAGVWADGGSVS